MSSLLRRNIVYFQPDDITASELTIDCQVLHGKVSDPTVDVELGPDGPYVLGPYRRPAAKSLPFSKVHVLVALRFGPRSSPLFQSSPGLALRSGFELMRPWFHVRAGNARQNPTRSGLANASLRA